MSILKKSRDKTFKSNAELQFKRFYGTGFFAYRFARAGSTTDGISLEELFVRNKPNDGRPFVFKSQVYSRKKPHMLLRAEDIIAGRADLNTLNHQSLLWRNKKVRMTPPSPPDF